jgi:hypothetical protein
MSTRDLVDAMTAGKSVDMESAFNACVAERVAEKLNQMKLDLAQTMFHSSEETETAVEE